MRAAKSDANMTVQDLTCTGRNGRRRIETFSWKRLAAIYRATTDPAVCRAIAREARRCGYNLRTILDLNAAE